jgi:cardiolipin synthase A/B
MLVDDAWATIGSCNLHSNSLSGHTEMNASIWDAAVVQPLRCALLAEHLGLDTANLDVRAALRLFRSIARENSRRRDAKAPISKGIAYQLDAETYGE